MRALLLLAALLAPTLVFVPTAHACTSVDATSVNGLVYLVAGSSASSAPAEATVGATPIGVHVQGCWFQGTRALAWQESNGTPGLQVGDGCAGGADAFLGEVFVTTSRTSQCAF